MSDGEKTRVVVILALPHSGSHLLSQLLGAHSRCTSIGELHNYDKFMHRSREGARNVTHNYADDEIFSGLASTPVTQWHEQILASVRKLQPGVTTLIDNSKRTGWAKRHMKNRDLEIIPVHLIRDPRALIRYWMLSYQTDKALRRQRIRHSRMAPLQAPALLTCKPLELYIRKWLIRNEEISQLLARTGYRRNLVSYHDLAVSPAQTLARLMPLLDLEYEPEQLNYGAVEQHGTRKREYESATTSSRIELDVRWQSFLDQSQISRVSEDGRLADYLLRTGLCFSESGLTGQSG